MREWGAVAALAAAAMAAPAAAAQPDFPIHIVAFHGADHAVSMPLLEAWEGFLRAEKAGIILAENIRARTDGVAYEFAPGGLSTETATMEVLETSGGYFALLPPDPKRLARF